MLSPRRCETIALLDNDHLPMELETEIDPWVTYYNTARYHQSPGNITPRDKYLGRAEEIPQKRRKIKKKTLNQRREANRFQQSRAGAPKGESQVLAAVISWAREDWTQRSMPMRQREKIQALLPGG
jgi:hypothetical protein